MAVAALVLSLLATACEIDGVPQEMSTPDVVAYRDEGGRSLQLQVLSVADLRDFSDGEELTLVDFLSVLVDSGELEELESVQLDTTMPLLWVVSSVVGDSEAVYTAVWGLPRCRVGFQRHCGHPRGSNRTGPCFHRGLT